MYKIKKTLFVILGVFLFVVQSSYALKENGGFSAPYFQADYIQELSEYSAAMVNPALLFRVNQIRVEAGAYRWGGVADALGYQQATVLIPVRLRHTLGATFLGSGASFDRATGLGTVSEEEGESAFKETWVIGHYSFRLNPWISLGANPKLLIQNHFDIKNYGFGLDLGAYANVFDHYRLGDLGVSLNFQDVIPPRIVYSGDDYGVSVMTTRLRAGLRYSGLNDRLIVDAEVVIDNIFEALWDGLEEGVSSLVSDSGDSSVGEIADAISEKVGRVSAHARFEWIPQIWFKVGWANNNIPYVGFNFNFIYNLPEMINYFDFDISVGYSFLETERSTFLMGKISTDVGPTREQRESKRLYDRLVLAPMNAYNEAMRLYVAGKFWEASFAFGKVLTLYPNFHLNDKATYYMGDCYVELRLNKLARKLFKGALAEFTTSEERANYLYGIERVDYREGKYKDALKNHAFISNLYAENDIKSDADYIAAQIHLQRKNYGVAKQLLEGISASERSYLFAQFTLAVVNIETERVNDAIECLVRVIRDTSSVLDIQNLRDAANNKLGQIYYENVNLTQAVAAFKRVEPNSRFGDDALMGIAWSWIKVNRPHESYVVISQLIASHPKSALIPEAYLLKGYTLMLEQRNQEARNSFEACLGFCRDEFENEDDLGFRKTKFEEFEDQFQPTAENMYKNALRKPTERIVSDRAGLLSQYELYERESSDLFYFGLRVDDNKDFYSRREQIVMDAEYALAKLTKILGSSKQQKIIKKDLKKQEKLDDEIERLQKQLENIE